MSSRAWRAVACRRQLAATANPIVRTGRMKTVRKVRIVADALQIAVSVFVQLYLKTELPFLF